MREAFSGVRRFEDFQAHLDIPRAILASRLDRLVDEGMLRREPYQRHPERHEYRLTEKGAEFYPVLAAMWRWGDDWLSATTRDRSCSWTRRPVPRSGPAWWTRPRASRSTCAGCASRVGAEPIHPACRPGPRPQRAGTGATSRDATRSGSGQCTSVAQPARSNSRISAAEESRWPGSTPWRADWG